ncbi:hypothetical protein [Halobacterium hubeiense]|uniref:hypothetical protein n=1 Tax=Halobacterium hubeiense TaxID=1407499 RepID=UPI003C73544A
MQVVLNSGMTFGAGIRGINSRHSSRDVRNDGKGDVVDVDWRSFTAVYDGHAKTSKNTSLDVGGKLRQCATTVPGETVLEDDNE